MIQVANNKNASQQPQHQEDIAEIISQQPQHLALLDFEVDCRQKQPRSRRRFSMIWVTTAAALATCCFVSPAICDAFLSNKYSTNYNGITTRRTSQKALAFSGLVWSQDSRLFVPSQDYSISKTSLSIKRSPTSAEKSPSRKSSSKIANVTINKKAVTTTGNKATNTASKKTSTTTTKKTSTTTTKLTSTAATKKTSTAATKKTSTAATKKPSTTRTKKTPTTGSEKAATKTSKKTTATTKKKAATTTDKKRSATSDKNTATIWPKTTTKTKKKTAATNGIKKPSLSKAHEKLTTVKALRREKGRVETYREKRKAVAFDFDDKYNMTVKKQHQYVDHIIIQNILNSDDTSGQTSDESIEAAQQIADKNNIVNMLSELSQNEVQLALSSKKVTPREQNSVDKDGGNAGLTFTTPTVKASVKETGKDTIGGYIKRISDHELLRREDEVILGRQVQILMKWEEKRELLEERMFRSPTYAEWAEEVNQTVPLLKQQIRRSQRAKSALIQANIRLVVTIARQTVKSGEHREMAFQDACQDGIIGLTRACERFDPERGFRFMTYAQWFIKRHVLTTASQFSRTIRLPEDAVTHINKIRVAEVVLREEMGRDATIEEVSEHMNLSPEKINFYKSKSARPESLDLKVTYTNGETSRENKVDFVADRTEDADDKVEEKLMQDGIRRIIRTLSPREQAVIRLRFGLDDGVAMNLTRIAEKFNAPVEKVRKIEARALLKLRQPYRNNSIKCYVSDV